MIIKKSHTIYISFLLLMSFFIIIIGHSYYPLKNIKTYPASFNYKEKIAYLTFDDGPSENTIKILDILDKYEIQATFFVVGPSYKLKNDLLKDIINRGHAIAIHSYKHEYSKIYQDVNSYLDDFYKCLNWITQNTDITPTIYRFPGGSSTTITSKENIEAIITSLNEKGYVHVDWNVDSYDSHYNDDVSAIVNATLNNIKINEFNKNYHQTILMHDNTKKVATVAALPSIIENLLTKGYLFKVLDNKSKLVQHVKRPT